jgi:CRP-like cAMP-binding protein
MPLTLSEARACGNLFLNRLSDEHFQELLPRLQRVHNRIKDVIYNRNQPVSYVHFPADCAFSVLVYMENGTAVEVGTVGNEGFTGVELLLHASTSQETCVCQVEGNSLRMTTEDFKDALKQIERLRHLAECYLQCYLALVSQSVACNRLHTIEARFARWLLITHDRLRGNEFYLTQEFIADMLGVHRPSVSLVAASFQSAGVIEYKRGHMKILSRQALEEASCECYAVVQSRFKRVLGIGYG